MTYFIQDKIHLIIVIISVTALLKIISYLGKIEINDPFEINKFNKKIIKSYWNEIKKIDKNSEFIAPFAAYLHSKIIVMQLIAQFIYSNSKRITRNEVDCVFEINRLFITNDLLKLEIPNSLKIELMEKAQLQVMELKEDILSIVGSKKRHQRQRKLIGIALINFISKNFKHSVMQFNINTKDYEKKEIEKASFFDEAELNKLIASGKIFDAIMYIHRNGKAQQETLQLLFRHSEYEMKVISNVLTEEQAMLVLNGITASVIMLSERISKGLTVFLIGFFAFFTIKAVCIPTFWAFF